MPLLRGTRAARVLTRVRRRVEVIMSGLYGQGAYGDGPYG